MIHTTVSFGTFWLIIRPQKCNIILCCHWKQWILFQFLKNQHKDNKISLTTVEKHPHAYGLPKYFLLNFSLLIILTKVVLFNFSIPHFPNIWRIFICNSCVSAWPGWAGCTALWDLRAMFLSTQVEIQPVISFNFFVIFFSQWKPLQNITHYLWLLVSG